MKDADTCIGKRLGKTDMEVFAPFLHKQLRFPFDKFNGNHWRTRKKQQRMTDHFFECFLHLKAETHIQGVRIFGAVDRRADLSILKGEIGKLAGIVEPGE